MTGISENLKDIKNSGGRIMGCYPLYPPVELLHSMGFTPVVLWGLRNEIVALNNSDRHLQTYACSAARHMTEFIYQNSSRFDGIFNYNACDTLRNMPEIIHCMLAEQGKSLPTFKLHIPAVSYQQSADAKKFFEQRLHGLISAIEKAYGVSFSGKKFAESIELYRTMRELCIKLETSVSDGIMPFSSFCEVVMEGYSMPIEEHIELLKLTLSECNEINPPVKRIVLSGVLPPPSGIFPLFERVGLRVSGNDLAPLKRSYAFTPETTEDPVEYYFHFYQEHFPCSTILYSSDRRLEELKNIVHNSGADGVVFIGEKFCECEYFEFPFIDKKLEEWGIPSLFLEISAEDRDNLEPYMTRIEAFSEML